MNGYCWVALGVLCVGLFGGCSDDTSSSSGGEATTDAEPGEELPDAGPISEPDSAIEADQTDGPEEDSAEEDGAAADDAQTQGELGDPCEVDSDCASNFCADSTAGRICTQLCGDGCPGGFTCGEFLQEGGGFLEYCVPAFPTLCWPCTTNDDCATAGISGSQRCVSFGDTGSFCGGGCADQVCPLGFSCVEDAVDVNGQVLAQCLPDTGVCLCSPAATAAGATTPCAASNAFGSCAGDRSCTEDGLSACSAVEPQAEVCDGVDNDCDGLSDEDFETTDCTQSNEFGVCPGATSCQGGEVVCSAAPATEEQCDGVDNDCDGETDEPGATGCAELFVDGDRDGYGGGAPSCICPGSVPAGGEGATAQIGGDCDDDSSAVNPGETEVCNGIDDNCQAGVDEAGAVGCSVYFADEDDDEFGVAGLSKCLCGPEDPFTATQSGDCNDESDALNPDAAEVCNGIDDNCDGNADPVGTTGCTAYLLDTDGDGAGVEGDTLCTCSPAFPYLATTAGDCNDSNPAVYEGQLETCNGIDDNCDGDTDGPDSVGCVIFYLDSDEDELGTADSQACLCAPTAPYTALVAGDCDDEDPEASLAELEACNGIDDDCDGQTDESGAVGCTLYYLDSDGDEYGTTDPPECLCEPAEPYTATVFGDCDDDFAEISPDAVEACNGFDDDCDSAIDEVDAVGCSTYYLDSDGDTWGIEDTLCLCAPAGDYSASQPGDCDDEDAKQKPDALEQCNGVDDNCDGETDGEGSIGCQLWLLDSDGDDFGVEGDAQCLCSPTVPYSAAVAGDCQDDNADQSPNVAELCNGLDDDCDGGLDEGCGVPVLGWATYKGDVRRTSQTLFEQGPLGASVAWFVDLDATPVGSPVIDANGATTAITATSIIRIDAVGDTVWSTPLPSPASGEAGPTLRSGGTTLVTAGDSVTLIGTNGQPLWAAPFAGELFETTAILDAVGNIFASSDAVLRRIAADGTPVWSLPATAIAAGLSFRGHPAISLDGSVLVVAYAIADGASWLVSVDGTTGDVQWTYELAGQAPSGSIAIGATGIAYVAGSVGLEAIGLTGTAVGTNSLGGGGAAAAAVFNTAATCCTPADWALATSSSGSGLWRLSPNLSTTSWSKPPSTTRPPSLDFDGDIWVVATSGNLHRKGTDGNDDSVWLPPDGSSIVTPVALTTGRLVVGTSSPRLYSITP